MPHIRPVQPAPITKRPRPGSRFLVRRIDPEVRAVQQVAPAGHHEHGAQPGAQPKCWTRLPQSAKIRMLELTSEPICTRAATAGYSWRTCSA